MVWNACCQMAKQQWRLKLSHSSYWWNSNRNAAGVISKRSEFSLFTAHSSSHLQAVRIVTSLMATRSLPDLYLLTYAFQSEWTRWTPHTHSQFRKQQSRFNRLGAHSIGTLRVGNFTLRVTRIKGICKHPTYRTRFQVIIIIIYTSVFQS